MELLTKKYQENITGTISCIDRLLISGTIPGICYAEGMTSYLYANNVKIFDYKKFFESDRLQIIESVKKLSEKDDLDIQYINQRDIRKEDLIHEILKKRGNQPGVVHIISAKETGDSFEPWCDKQKHTFFLKYKQAQFLHYYIYFIDEELGLGYIKIPTWPPYRVQVYINGHNWLATQLDKANIKYSMVDNAFDRIDDFNKAQKLSDNLCITILHKRLDAIAEGYLPILDKFKQKYHWSIMQIEYSKDIIFKEQKFLQAIYSELIATAIHTVKPEDIMTFLGKKMNQVYQGEVGNRYNVRLEGSRLKHQMGKNSIKMYDKYQKILRIEATSNDISSFRINREVEQRDGIKMQKLTSMKKSIYSLGLIQDVLNEATNRYLKFISTIDDKKTGREKLHQITTTKVEQDRTYKGFNIFEQKDEAILTTLVKGEYNIKGFQSKDIRGYLGIKSPSRMSRIFKRLRLHNIIRKVRRSYKYYLTNFGRDVIALALKVKELVIIPQLNHSLI